MGDHVVDDVELPPPYEASTTSQISLPNNIDPFSITTLAPALDTEGDTPPELPPPAYTPRAASSTSHAAAPAPLPLPTPVPPPQRYRPIPAVLTARTQGSATQYYMKLCGASPDDAVYTVWRHGLPNAVLGNWSGIVLHGGISHRSAVLAAAGDNVRDGGRLVKAWDPESVILMPPVVSGPAATSGGSLSVERGGLVEERMYARMDGGNVLFLFDIEVGSGGQMRRERFAWKKVKKGAEPGMKHGGFQLAWLSGGSGASVGGADGGSSSQCASSCYSSRVHVDDRCEFVATFVWTSWFFRQEFFTLRFRGSGLSGVLGDSERWKLMVVVTAVRLADLKHKDKTADGLVAMGERMQNNLEVDS